MLAALQDMETKTRQKVSNNLTGKMAYYKATAETLKNRLAQITAGMDDTRAKIDSCKGKINNQQSVLLALQEKLAAENKALAEETENYKMKQFELSVQEKLCAELKDQLDQFQCEPKLCDSDMKLLAESRRKLNLYYRTTRVRWDYSAPESEVKGYVTNVLKTAAEPFTFSVDDGPVCDKLWNVVAQVVDTDWKDLDDVTLGNVEE